jgi:peptidoglycan/LPS O-acetylase OafA/YrhL/lysophospholipase L1-like esterase
MARSTSAVAKGFIQELDGLRGIAILMVMVHRFWPRTGMGLGADVAGTGWIGVDLFFVISGFLITGILLDTRADAGYFKNFYARRALRIFPLYYVFVIGTWALFWRNPEFHDRAGSPLWYLFHLGNVPEGVLGKNVPYWLAPVWSLAIEEQFYLTFPWLVRFLDRRRLTYVLVGLIAIAPVIRLVTMLAFPDHERVQYLFTPCRVDTLAAGCLLAVIVREIDLERWRQRIVFAALAVLPSVVVLGIASRLDRTSPFDRVFGYSIVAAGCASVVALVILGRGRRSTALLRLRPLTYLGKLCFGLYLLHRPADTIVSALATRLDIHGDLWLLAPKIVVAVILATVSWRVLERPLLRLKDRFATSRHPAAAKTVAGTLGLIVLLGACRTDALTGDAPPAPDAAADVLYADADPLADAPTGDAAPDAIIDAPPDAMETGRVLYPEGARHSPITAALAMHLQQIAGVAQQPQVFAKVGDSITVSPSFLSCFDGGTVDLGAHGALAPTLAYYMAGDAAGSSPYARVSLAAKGGTTAQDALTGSPSPLDQELTAVTPRIAIVLFGTNEARTGWSVDDFGTQLWTLIDRTLERGVIPVMSTLPPNTGYPEADAQIPTFNRIVRAIAQGRGVPLVDLHDALEPLPGRGISDDGLHPSVAPDGGCVLTAAGLQYGYNVRNLLTLEALDRTRAALAGQAADASATTLAGSGTEVDPFEAALPLVDLGDTQDGEAQVDHGCGAGSGRQVVYRVSVAAATTLDVHVVDHASSDVRIRIVAGGTCVGAGASSATAIVGAGDVDVIVASPSASGEGEYLVAITAR